MSSRLVYSVFGPDTEGETNPIQEMEVSSRPPEMTSMHVDSYIRNRYARTVVTSKYLNEDVRAQEATFSIVLPDTAFIAGFVMEIKGKKYEAYVKEKAEAKQDYDSAVSCGRAAAHVAVSARDSNKFTVSANVQPHSDVTFILAYEELLVRKHSKYDIVINLHPTQFLDDLQVDVHINETRPVVDVHTPALRSGNEITTAVTSKKYEAYVKEKAEAKQDYDAAVSCGRAAAHIAVSARDSNKFTVSANVQPHSDVTFILAYEELLVRKHSKYNIVINLHPTQFLDDLQVDVHINETRPVVDVQTPALRSGNEITTTVTRNKYATISKDEDNVVHVNFKPTIDQQKEMAKAMEAAEKIDHKTEEFNSISGQFIVQYDVERDPLGGEVLVNDGYFVHFFAPTDLKPIPKHVIFVLDVSGSMGGTKLMQLKEAMSVILDELNPKDHFNLVKFSDRISVLNNKFKWDEIDIPTEANLPNSFEVSDKNIKSIKTVIKLMTEEGRTNIYDALVVGLRMTSKGILHLPDKKNQHKPQPIIVFLTDGLPNVSESNPDKIIEMVRYRNDTDNKSTIFGLAFGFNADAKFLKELAIQNSGFARHIYEASDASIQLQDFYKQISSPLLTNVKFNYTEDIKVQDLTRYNFEILFKGSEIVVAGKSDKLVDDFVFVEALNFNGSNKYYPTITREENKCKLNSCENRKTNIETYGSLERLWAYITIKQLLDKKFEKECEKNSSNNQLEQDKNNKQKKIVEEQALKLALKYSFVTPVTSLVVVKPDEPPVEENATSLQNFSWDTPKAAPCFKKKIMKRKLRAGYFPDIISIESEDQDNIVKLNNIIITCDVRNHIAYIAETRTYQNCSANPEEFSYHIELPEEAIVTQFFLKGVQNFKGIGHNETEAKNQYKTAIANNLDAALVNLQDLNKVTVNVHIMPGNEITLILHYQKNLQNKNNKYDLNMNLNNEKFIDNVAVIVSISEERAVIKNLLPYLKYQNEIIENKYATVNKSDENLATIEFNASEKLQEEIAKALNIADNKFSCQFIVKYEIEQNLSAIQDLQSNTAAALSFPYLVAFKA